jgi:hypothetical protein
VNATMICKRTGDILVGEVNGDNFLVTKDIYSGEVEVYNIPDDVVSLPGNEETVTPTGIDPEDASAIMSAAVEDSEADEFRAKFAEFLKEHEKMQNVLDGMSRKLRKVLG